MNALMLAMLLGLTPSNQETPTATDAPTPNDPTSNVVAPAPVSYTHLTLPTTPYV